MWSCKDFFFYFLTLKKVKGILKVKWHAMYLGMLIKVQSQEGTIKKTGCAMETKLWEVS